MTSKQPPTVAIPQHAPMTPAPMPARRSTWPMVLGVIAVVFGSLGALGGIWGIAGQFMLGALAKLPGQAETMAALKAWRPWLIGVSAATIVIAACLILGGAMLIQRRRAARNMLLLWALLKIALVVVATIISYQVNRDQFAAMQRSGTTMPAGMQSIMSAIGSIGAILSLAWGWALPVFLIIWLLRPRIAREISEWR